MWTDFFDKIYLINIPVRTERLANATAELNKWDIPFDVIPAIVDPDGAMGLYLTMLELFYKISNDINRILIFEDDIHFVNDVHDTMEKCVKQLSPIDWDLFYLGVNTHQPFINQPSPNLLQIFNGYSTHAVAYNHSAIQIIKDLPYHTAIDVMLAGHIQSKGKSFCSYPLIATQRNGYSDIDKKEVTYDYIIERFNKHTIHLPLPK